MAENLTVATFLPWLAQEAQSIARAMTTEGDAFPDLWLVATDAQDWLRNISADERADSLRRVEQCLNSGSTDGAAIPTDEREAKFFTTLLRWILRPPAVL